MSLLLDALKEAEARKRDAATPMAIATSPAPATEAGSATVTEATFDNLGALALAEDVHPGPVATDFGAARGHPYDRERPKPVPAGEVAHAVIRAVERGRHEALVAAGGAYARLYAEYGR